MIASIAGLLLVMALAGAAAVRSRRWINHEILAEQNGGLQVYVAMLATFYGVLIALVFVSHLENHKAVEGLLERECDELLFLYRMAASLPAAEDRERLEAAVQKLAVSVVEKEWPAMEKRDTRALLLAPGPIDNVWKALMQVNLSDSKVSMLVNEAVDRYGQFAEARRNRVFAVRGSLPPMMWLILLVGATFCIAVTYQVGMPSVRHHAAYTAMTCGLIFLLLLLIYEYQHPFEGPLAVSQESYLTAIERMKGSQSITVESSAATRVPGR